MYIKFWKNYFAMYIQMLKNSLHYSPELNNMISDVKHYFEGFIYEVFQELQVCAIRPFKLKTVYIIHICFYIWFPTISLF